jgi:hypothetical protein
MLYILGLLIVASVVGIVMIVWRMFSNPKTHVFNVSEVEAAEKYSAISRTPSMLFENDFVDPKRSVVSPELPPTPFDDVSEVLRATGQESPLPPAPHDAFGDIFVETSEPFRDFSKEMSIDNPHFFEPSTT